jgi:hypothetical protein
LGGILNTKNVPKDNWVRWDGKEIIKTITAPGDLSPKLYSGTF